MTEGDEPLLALAFLKKHLGINPDNHPLTMAYADALSGAREYSEAVKVLENHAVIRPEDHALWSIIAETQGRAGNISKVHQARAEYLILQGDYLRAREQISFALKLETEKGSRSIQVTKLKQKMRDIEALQRAVRA